MRLFGYARVSTSQQSLELQTKALTEAGVSPLSSIGFLDRQEIKLLPCDVEPPFVSVCVSVVSPTVGAWTAWVLS